MEVSEEVPEFGGVHFSEDGRLVISVTNEARFYEAFNAVKRRMTSHRTSTGVVTSENAMAVVRTVEHSFGELVRTKSALRYRLLEMNSVVSLDVSERANRVIITAVGVDAEADVRAIAADLNVAARYYEVRTATGTRDLSNPDLDGLMGPSHGAWRIVAGGACSLGFSARRVSDALPVLVTNSHCTEVTAGLDGGPMQQQGTVIGYEIVDPEPHTCGAFVPGPCRNADAALFAATTSIRLGKIARTTFRSPNSSGPLTINTANPTLSITSKSGYLIENEVLDKIGATTGWTFGPVEDVCADWRAFGESLTKQCSDRVDFGGDAGDSGAPVLSLKANGTVELRGVVFGSAVWPYSDALMSNIGRIEMDLGGLTVYDAGGPSITVDGPVSVPPGAICSWTATVSGGVPPYVSPGWTGLHPSPFSTVAAVSDTAGWLFYEVTDYLGRSNVASVYVDVVGSPGPIICPP